MAGMNTTKTAPGRRNPNTPPCTKRLIRPQVHLHFKLSRALKPRQLCYVLLDFIAQPANVSALNTRVEGKVAVHRP
eukprot:15465157-Alexandrium_andersonii.AAC.1